jgi:hypothetical protein
MTTDLDISVMSNEKGRRAANVRINCDSVKAGLDKTSRGFPPVVPKPLPMDTPRTSLLPSSLVHRHVDPFQMLEEQDRREGETE